MATKRRYQTAPAPTARLHYDSPAQVGMKGVHRDGAGAVIGGYTQQGAPLGTKQRAWQAPLGRRAGNPSTPGLDRLAAIQPGADRVPFDPAGKTYAATGNVLNQRQNLFKAMEKAGPDGITEDMRKKARGLKVSDSGFNAAAKRIKDNAAAIAPGPTQTVPLPPGEGGSTAAGAPSVPPVRSNGRPRIVGQFKPGSELDLAEKELWTKPKPGANPLDEYENIPMSPEMEAKIRASGSATVAVDPAKRQRSWRA